MDYWPSWILHFCIYFGCRILYQNPVPDSGVTSDIFWTSNTGSTLLDRLNPWLSVRWAVVFFFDPAVMICFAHSTRQCISVENSADSATDPLDRTQRLNWFPVVRFDHWSRDYLWFVSALAVGLLINELNVWGLAAHDWVAAGHCGLEGFASYTNPVNLAVSSTHFHRPPATPRNSVRRLPRNSISLVVCAQVFASITTWYFSNLVAVLSSDAPQGVSKLIASAFRILLHFLVWLSFYNATIAIAVAILIASAVTRARSVLSPCSQS